MSRNQNRTGQPDDNFLNDESPAPISAVGTGTGASTDTQSFAWSVPTEFVEIPSGGRFYGPDHPLHNATNVEIKFMTAKEEDILTSRSLLKEGVALDRMLQNLLVDKTVQIDTLLVGDKNALLVAARRTGYGPDYDTNVTCPACGAHEEFSFDISNPPTNSFEQKIVEHGVTLTDNHTLLVNLPMTQATVECRMLNGADELRLYKEMERKAKRKAAGGGMTDAFRSYIISINGNPSPIAIESFIQALPARDGRLLRNVYTECIPNIDMTQHFECSNCSHTADMEVPLSADFFWPK
jgi:hypothetical protein